jgi:uncharacterized membrane protein YfcA
VVYHFMFGPHYTAGCTTCSSIADSFNGVLPHLKAQRARSLISFLFAVSVIWGTGASWWTASARSARGAALLPTQVRRGGGLCHRDDR